KPHLDASNLLAVKYEDLVTNPKKTMQSVYSHLNLPNSLRFLETFNRPFPARFLWETSVDWESGITKDFDTSRISSWKTLTDEQLDRVYSSPYVLEFMERFGYPR